MLTIKVRAYRETTPKWCFKVTPQRVKRTISLLNPTFFAALQRRSVRRGGNKEKRTARTTLGPPGQTKAKSAKRTQLKRIHTCPKLEPARKHTKKGGATRLQVRSLDSNGVYGPNATRPKPPNVRLFSSPQVEKLYLVYLRRAVRAVQVLQLVRRAAPSWISPMKNPW